MTTAVIVQARVGSTRLPGKILKPLGRHTVLEEMLRRCRAIRGADVVVCAIPDSPDDDIIAPIVERAHCVLTRGSGPDVLARYAGAARLVNADIVMRVTSDCPLIDPDLCADVLALRASDRADYACNNMPPSFPHGLDCEAFTTQSLLAADANARQPDEREHVTPWLRKNDKLKRANLMGPDPQSASQRWTLDYEDDYRFLAGLFDLLPRDEIPSWQQTMQIVSTHPRLSDLNAMHRARA